MKPWKRESKPERGQSLVEFAAGLVLLLILVAGIVDGGRALFTYMSLRDAAQEGAFYGSVSPTDEAGIKGRVLGASSFVADIINASNISISFDGQKCIGYGVTIKVTLPNFQITMPFLGAIIGSQTVPISASVTDTILRPYDCP